MKKITSIVALSGLVFASCSEDKTTTEPTDEIVGKWVPKNVELIQVVKLYEYDYPHTVGCDKDFLDIQSTTQGTFTHFSGTECKAKVASQAFSKEGSDVKLNLNGVEVSGKATFSGNQMYITGSLGDYTTFFQEYFPEYASMISMLSGATVKMTFDKK
ncbi:hypothetical protein AB4865_03245 [Capnocytophaga sp. ARDL2]|uniref:hypothetical protein n=1 Tax=Capnocytophaga sp. ARDL2 TaxID=3238809 RepID=UPI0035578C9D